MVPVLTRFCAEIVGTSDVCCRSYAHQSHMSYNQEQRMLLSFMGPCKYDI